MSLMEDLQLASQVIQQADALVIAAGAGMGVDSGLPDFRGREGFWQAYPALAKAKLDFTQVASPHTFEVDPALAWGFYGHRLDLYRRTIPHQGFEILRQWGESKALGYWVFTSNVDGQFQKAGFSKESMNECHGSIHHLQCINDCHGHIWSADGFFPEVNEEHCLLRNALPQCPSCSKLARPNILMFGDGDWNPSRQLMQQRFDLKNEVENRTKELQEQKASIEKQKESVEQAHKNISLLKHFYFYIFQI